MATEVESLTEQNRKGLVAFSNLMEQWLVDLLDIVKPVGAFWRSAWNSNHLTVSAALITIISRCANGEHASTSLIAIELDSIRSKHLLAVDQCQQ